MPSFSWHQGNGQRCKDSVYELFQPTVHRMQLTAVTDIPFSSAYQVTLCHPPSASDYMTDDSQQIALGATSWKFNTGF